ncbi:MAG: sodium:solute symporter [Bacteroidales bacterium]|nr:sodium:solute symporter [Bacteroidales bacterium]MBN2756099.1 sodium:solute symporter [Bacteroidales bacterium]
MSPILVFSVIAAYFSLLILISYFTSRKSNTETFFTGNKQSPWFLVAFGMIGASLSGVTFISVPGEVGNSNFAYFQMVIGYLLGYFVIATVLLPIYYKLNLVSIYTYLEKRFGFYSYKTGSIFFLISRVIGASFRLFLVATVLQLAFFDNFGIPFSVTVIVTILLIWVYTNKAGIKTIVWTDTLQTSFMLLAVIISVILIGKDLNLSFTEIVSEIKNSTHSTIFDWNWKSGTNFFKQFIGGAFIAIAMTGLDQDMMQKNLTCRNIKDAQKNMFWFSITLLPVNFLFLSLGVLLYTYVSKMGISFESLNGFIFNEETARYLQTDKLYPSLAINNFSIIAGITFLLGIIAAAFSSADSALTALTTSFTVDILGIDVTKESKETQKKKRLIHLGFSFLIFIVILIFKIINDDSVINMVFKVAGYTYGPLLGLFTFGLFTKRKIIDKFVPIIAVLSPILTFVINYYSEAIFFGYKFGFELLLVNGFIMFLGLYLLSIKSLVNRNVDFKL